MAKDDYNASDLQLLEGLEAVRKVPGMYIGATDSRGFTHLLWEVADNSVDEALAGYATKVDVILHSDGSVEVRDDGRGIPVDINPQTKLPGVVMIMTSLHAGGKFGGAGYSASGGLHGVGASVVNALSTRVDVSVKRGGKTHSISFQNGVAGQYDDKGKFKAGPTMKVSPGAKGTGTTTRYWPDLSAFDAGSTIEVDEVLERLRQTSFMVPGLTLTLIDRRGGQKIEETFHSTAGIADFVTFLARKPLLSDVITITGSQKYKQGDDEKEMSVDIAFSWENDYNYVRRPFTNGIANNNGGTHMVGFERAVVKSIIEAARVNGSTKEKDGDPTKDDILEGLVAVVTVRIPGPQFTSQTKDELSSKFVSAITADIVNEQLRAWLASPKRKSQVKAITDKVATAQKARIAARAQRELIRKKGAVESEALPTKLFDCNFDDLEDTELLICEGDSAAGALVQARDSDFQAVFPIRGKILNVHKATLEKVLKNQEVLGIFNSVGGVTITKISEKPLKYEVTFNLEKIRYGKVIMFADADVDGSHIRCLLITLFWNYMREFILAGRLYTAVPPLYILKVVGSDDPLYAYTEEDKDRQLEEILKKGQKLKSSNRLKGIGEQDPEETRDSALLRGHRILRRITALDVEAAQNMLDLWMGPDAEPRKDAITIEAATFDRDLIDV